jgi:hypothetical protein
MLRQLDVQGIMDREVPIREVAHLAHGEVLCAMVANRLTARTTALVPLRPVGRALDVITPHVEALQGSVTWSAMQASGIDISEVHYDLISITFTGAYDEAGDQQVPGLGLRVSPAGTAHPHHGALKRAGPTQSERTTHLGAERR